MVDTGVKQCSRCKRVLPATAQYFYRRTGRKQGQGFDSWCRECKGSHFLSESCHEGYKRCNQCHECKPLSADYFYHDASLKSGFAGICIECKLENGKEFRVENRERLRIRAIVYRAKYGGKHRISQAGYQRRNPHKTAVFGQRYRARKRNLPDTFTVEDERRMMGYWHNSCAVCGIGLEGLFDFTQRHVDHWIPLNSLACPGTTPDNMLPLCESCNLSKNRTPPDEWLTGRYGDKEAQKILRRVERYFKWVKQQS